MDISLKSLEEAVRIRRRIGSLEKRLSTLLGGRRFDHHSAPKRKKGMSVQARAKIAAATRARWAKRRRKTARAKTAKRKGGITAAGRRRLSQLMKARWAARRKARRKK